MGKKGWDIVPEPVSTPENLAKLFYIHAYSRGKFLLCSGKTSSYYLNGKQVILSAQGLYISARLLLERMAAQPPDAVGGLSFGAAPLAAAISAFSCCFGYENERPISSFIVRKATKEHGTRSRIEGPFYRGARTIIVDDVLTTGGSVLSAARAAEEAGGIVEKIYVLVDRLEGGKESLAELGYRLESIITRKDLEQLDRLLQQKYPTFFSLLDRQPLDWTRLADSCREISTHHPRLGAALEQKISCFEKEYGPLPALPPGLRSHLLRPVKIADLSLDRETASEEAYRVLNLEFSGGGNN